MGMQVDETGGDQLALGIDFLAALADRLANGSDRLAINGYVGNEGRCAGAIDYGSAPDDQIVHRLFPLTSYRD